MTRRARGDGGLSWDDKRQRWIAAVTVGYDGRGKRVFRRASGRTKTEAKARLREILRDHDDGLLVVEGFTVRDAVEDWLAYGLTNRHLSTRTTCAHLCRKHVSTLPHLGARKLATCRPPRLTPGW